MKIPAAMTGLFVVYLSLSCSDAAVSGSMPHMPSAVAVRPALGATANSRFFLVLLDSSVSYKDYEAALRGLSAALNNLRPGDQFALARVNEKVVSKNFVILNTSSGKLDADLLVPPKTISEWQDKNKRLAKAWGEVDAHRRIIAAALQKLQGANTAKLTDLHEALRYSIPYLNDQTHEEKALLVCSDLEHDTGKPTFKPPATPLDVARLHIKLLFVPGNTQHLARLEADWKKYFGRAKTFGLFDSGRSPAGVVIPPSSVPRRHPMPSSK
jgi:hypothetical protein